MGSVNKLIWRVCLPALGVFYLAFLFLDYKVNNPYLYVDTIKSNLSTSSNVDALILGGSNATYSLSASIMEDKTNLSWLNLSLLNEGNSTSNYWDFIESNLSEIQRSNVKKVIYSSIATLSDDRGIINREKNSTDIYGVSRDAGWFPKSFLPYRASVKYFWHIKEHKDFNFNTHMPNKLGDYDFSLFKCTYRGSELPLKLEINSDKKNEWVKSQLTTLRKLFPNATLYFVIPSVLYKDPLNTNQIDMLSQSLNSYVMSFNKSYKDNVIFIQEATYPSKDFICDVNHHANEIGRSWRTNQLLEEMIKKK